MSAKSVNVSRGCEIDNEKFALVVQTQHGPITATTAVHQQKFARRIGGVRFVTKGSLAEVGHLAKCMTDKCFLAEIPADGQKTIVVCPEGLPNSDEFKAAIMAEHIRAVISFDPGCIFGPDMNVPESVLDLLSRESDLLDHVTGLSEGCGGLGIDRNGYTAHGIAYGVNLFCKERGLIDRTITIQGLGAVGAHVGRLLDTENSEIVAVSTAGGALVARPGSKLPGRQLFEYWTRFGEDAPEKYFRSLDVADGFIFDPNPDLLFTVPTDIFIPAARTSVLAMPEEMEVVRKENSSVRDVCEFLAKTGVRVVAEAANHPLTTLAEGFLESYGVGVLPDYVINCGGLIACYIEWALRENLLRSDQSRKSVERQARVRIEAAIGQRMKRMLDHPTQMCSNAHAAVLADSAALEQRYGLSSAKNGHQTAAFWLSEHLDLALT